MRATTPWSDELSSNGSGDHCQRPAAAAWRSLRRGVGARLPLHHYEQLRSAVQHITKRDQPLTPAGLRSVREALLALERTVWLRIEMRSAFSGEPIMVERLEIPPW